MIENNFLDSGDDFDVLCNVVSILLVEYDVVTEMTNVAEEFSVAKLVDHKLVCYYVINNDMRMSRTSSSRNPI